MANLKDHILGVNDLVQECIHVPEWGVDVYIRMMTGTEKDEVSHKAREGISEGEDSARTRNAFLLLLCKTLCDENGVNIFRDSDAMLLMRKNPIVIERLIKESMRINMMGKGAEEDAKKKSETP